MKLCGEALPDLDPAVEPTEEPLLTTPGSTRDKDRDRDRAVELTEELLRASSVITNLPCRGSGASYFAKDPRQRNYAKAQCTPCPIRELCLAAALANRERWGVWGGTTAPDRRKILRLEGINLA